MASHPEGKLLLGANIVALLDCLRAVAANLVLFGHASDIFKLQHRNAGGGMGVGIFFILSGFLIMESSLGRVASGGGSHFVSFMLNRTARIFTAYIPALIAVACANMVLDLGVWAQPGVSVGPLAFAGNLFLIQDYPIFQMFQHGLGHAVHIRSYNTAEPFWTIPIEFCLYIVFGLSFFGVFAREHIGRGAAIVLSAFAVPVVVWNAAAGGGNGLSIVWMLGAVGGYLWSGPWRHAPNRVQIGLVLCVAASTCLAGRALKFGCNFQDLNILFCEAVLFLGLLSVADGLPRAPRMLRAVCSGLAAYSYSLYLVHNTVLIVFRQKLAPVLGEATLPLAIAAAHLVAILLCLCFERHYRYVSAVLRRLIVGHPAQGREEPPLPGRRPWRRPGTSETSWRRSSGVTAQDR
jgi:peptidoglycan/LPS O-acetylase OafA/YrhL